MTTRNLRRLIDHYAPTDSLETMARRAGMPEHRLRELFKTRAPMGRLPRAEVIVQIADAIGCTPNETLHALLDDRGFVFEDTAYAALTSRMHQTWFRLPLAARRRALDTMSQLLNGDTPPAAP